MGRYGVTNGKRYPKLYETNQGGAAGRVGLVRPSLDRLVTETARPSPCARDFRDDGDSPAAHTRKSPGLPATVRAQGEWHSPCAGDAKDVPYRRDHGTPGKERAALLGQANGQHGRVSPSTTGSRRARLNFRWVAVLQGFPESWLDSGSGRH